MHSSIIRHVMILQGWCLLFQFFLVPKKQMLRKQGCANDQSNIKVHQIFKAKRDVAVSSASPVTQTQKAFVHPISGVSMAVEFH
ncbi:hypothetical protein U1Q18_041348 [Sarracenia purpurea var. burkii]